MGRLGDFHTRGWTVFAPEPSVRDWAWRARAAALQALEDPALAHWYECENTWFVGVDALPNDCAGAVRGGPPLTGAAVDFVTAHCGGWPALHPAQISAVFPGYPKPRAGETDAAFRYRRDRDAAHVDGVIGEGQPKRRFVREPHAFILGLPLTEANAGAAPLVVWDGSHRIMQDAFAAAFARARTRSPESIDVTAVYQQARQRVFDTCARVPLIAPPGGAMLLHRLAVHGVAPFEEGAKAAREGRIIAYFRPPMPGGAAAWVTAP